MTDEQAPQVDTKVRHTPGPWRAEFNSAYWQIAQADGFMRVGDTCASSVCAPEYGRSLALGEANARLMAAAPDLLAACKAWSDAIREACWISRLTGEQLQHLTIMTRAAIAAAEGGAA